MLSNIALVVILGLIIALVIALRDTAPRAYNSPILVYGKPVATLMPTWYPGMPTVQAVESYYDTQPGQVPPTLMPVHANPVPVPMAPSSDYSGSYRSADYSSDDGWPWGWIIAVIVAGGALYFFGPKTVLGAGAKVVHVGVAGMKIAAALVVFLMVMSLGMFVNEGNTSPDPYQPLIWIGIGIAVVFFVFRKK